MWVRDINSCERRCCTQLQHLWPLGPPILGWSRSFSGFPPLFPHNERHAESDIELCIWILRPASHIAMPRCTLLPRDTRPVSPSLMMRQARTWHQLTSSQWSLLTPGDVLKSAMSRNECLSPLSPLLTSLSPHFLPPSLARLRLPNIEAWEYLKASCPLSVNNNKTLFLTEGRDFYTGIERFLFVWLALQSHITEKRAADWVPGRVHHYPIIVTKPAPRVPVTGWSSVTKFP